MKSLLTYFPLFLGISALTISVYSKLSRSSYLRKRVTALELLPEENCISLNHAKEGINELFLYATQIRPDHIVGINRGGVMIAASIMLGLNLPAEKFSRCLVIPGKNKVECDNLSLSGRVLIIDDISRSGKTLKLSREFLEKKCPAIKNFFLATLVICLNKEQQPVFTKINYAFFSTKNTDLFLPWTKKIPRSEREGKREYFVDEVKAKPIPTLVEEIRSSLSE